MSEPTPIDDLIAPPEEPTAAATNRAEHRRTAIVNGVLGLALLLTGIGPASQTPGHIRLIIFLSASALLFVAVDRGGKAWWGEKFEAGLWLSGIWLLSLTLGTVFASLLPLAPHDSVAKALGNPPNLRPDLLSEHPLGTNGAALDLLARSVYAARVSLGTAGLAIAISLIVGMTAGMIAGYRRGRTDALIGVLTDTALAIPGLVILIAMAAMLGVPETVPSAIVKEGLALGLVSVPTMVRLARANTLTFAQREFVAASRALGASNTRILTRHLLPNVLAPVLSYAFILAAVLIVAEGSLAFLGLGLQQPQPTWGNMIAEGSLSVLRRHPHVPFVPGAFMFLTVFSFNRIGEWLRERSDRPVRNG